MLLRKPNSNALVQSGAVQYVQFNGLRPLLGALGIFPPQQQRQTGDLLQVFGSCGSSTRSIVINHTHVPRAKHDRYRTPPRNYVQLLQHIARSRDVSGLSRLVQAYGAKFDAVHVAAAVAKLPKLYQPPAPGNHLNEGQLKERKKHAAKLLAQLQVTTASLVPRMYAAQVSSITQALSRCSSLLPGRSTANSTTQQLLDAMLRRMTADHARLLWQGATGPAITQLLHGLSRMGYSPSSSSGSAAAAAARTTQQLCRMIAKDPSRLQVRELATAAWALGRISRKRPGLLQEASTAAALDAISAEVVGRKLWLRPNSMTGLLTAAAWMGRKDEVLLAAVCEEAAHQVRDLRPPHLAGFVWALSVLDYTPPPELLTGIVAESRRQLEFFSAGSLGLLLLGLRHLKALDRQLLSDIAAGIAAEQRVSLSPRDAAHILAAFVAVPDAGTVKDVDGMAQRIGSAVRLAARYARASVITDLVVCYSKLQYHHPMVPQLLEEAMHKADEFTLGQWVKLLQSAARLGFGRVVADVELEVRLSRFYRAADTRLQQHLLAKVLQRPAAGSRQQQEDDGEEKGLPEKLKSLFAGKQEQQQPERQQHVASEQQQQQQQQQQQRSNEVGAIADMASLLAQRGTLSDASMRELADASVQMLPVLKLRQLMHLLTAATSKEAWLADESVRQLLTKAAQHIKGLDLGTTPTASTLVLVNLLAPLSKAMSRELALFSGEAAVRALCAELLPVLEECDHAQLQTLWQALRRSKVEDAGLAARAKEVAARNGWQLQTGSLSVV